MASDSEPEGRTADEQQASRSPKAASSDRPKKKKARRPRPPIPRTEAEIDSPSKQTLGMLGILCAMTVIMWAFARGACNYHPPKETRVPRQVSTAELARDPKNAAVEVQQRWLTHDFAGALELATGSATSQIQRDQAACNASCLAARPALEKSVLTTAALLEASPLGGATARVTSVGLPGGAQTYLLHLERSDTIWKASERLADTGTVPGTGMPGGTPAAVPATSASVAVPATSASVAVPAASASANGVK